MGEPRGGQRHLLVLWIVILVAVPLSSTTAPIDHGLGQTSAQVSDQASEVCDGEAAGSVPGSYIVTLAGQLPEDLRVGGLFEGGEVLAINSFGDDLVFLTVYSQAEGFIERVEAREDVQSVQQDECLELA